MAMPKVLSTKKLSLLLRSDAAKNGIDLIEQEFISVKPIQSEEKRNEIIDLAKAKKAFVVFTSANAVTAVEQILDQGEKRYSVDWKLFCLSGKTKEAVLNAAVLGKNIVTTAETAKALAQQIITHGVNEIVFFCGNKRRDDLPALLKEAGVTVQEVVVYETRGVPAVAAADVDAVLFFSPSAVKSFFAVNQLKENAVCFAIGETTAAAVSDFMDNKIITAEAPSPERMMAAVQEYFQHNSIRF